MTMHAGLDAACRSVLVVMACAATAGCPSAKVDTQSLTDFRNGLVAVQQSSNEVFHDVNVLARRTQLDRVVTKPAISEKDLAPALDAASIAQWNRSLEALGAYASSIEVLTSPERGAGVQQSVEALGNRIATLGKDPQAGGEEPTPSARPKALTQAFGRLAKIVVTTHANSKALTLMQEADPHVRDVLTHMADMIGEAPPLNPGVRTTVWSSWTTIAGQSQVAFTGATTPDAKRRIAEEYAKVLESRASADGALLAIRQSLLNLADAHTAASQGRSASAAEIVAFLREQVEFARGLVKALEHEE